jgi:hypothetical protein
MSETPQNATPSQSSSSSTSAPVSPTPEPKPTSAEPSKEDKVKALIEHAEKKHAKRQPEQTTEVKRTEETKPTEKAEAKPDKHADKSGDKKLESGDPKLDKPPEIDGDPVIAKRLAAIQRAEDKARIATESLTKERATFENEKASFKDGISQWQGFVKTFPEDPVKALQNLGLKDEHLEALYWRLNADTLKRAKDGTPTLTHADVEKRAREIAAEEFDRRNQEAVKQNDSRYAAAMTEARNQYIGKVAAAFNADPSKFPAVKAWGIQDSDIHSYVDDEYKGPNKRIPTPEEVLAHFEKKHVERIEASGYKKPQVDAPKAEEKRPIPSKTVTADWQAGSSPSSDKSTSQSLKESRDEIRRKLDQGFFKRNRA